MDKGDEDEKMERWRMGVNVTEVAWKGKGVTMGRDITCLCRPKCTSTIIHYLALTLHI